MTHAQVHQTHSSTAQVPRSPEPTLQGPARHMRGQMAAPDPLMDLAEAHWSASCNAPAWIVPGLHL